jgi:hypothetical protein
MRIKHSEIFNKIHAQDGMEEKYKCADNASINALLGS